MTFALLVRACRGITLGLRVPTDFMAAAIRNNPFLASCPPPLKDLE